MITFRDHPLAFLTARSCPTALLHRAQDWRRKGHLAQGLDVAEIFEDLAAEMELCRRTFSEVEKAVVNGDYERAAGLLDRLFVNLPLADSGFQLAQQMREQGLDPYGGSTSASLENALEEFEHLSYCRATLLDMVCEEFSPESIRSVVLDALDMAEAPEATHEAPACVM